MGSKIKILDLIPYKIFPAKSGGQKCIAFFVKHLNRQLPVAAAGVQSNEMPAGLEFEFDPCISDSKSRYFDLSLIRLLGQRIRVNNVTHIMTEHVYWGWLLYFLKKITGAKIIIHSHNIESQRFRSIGKWWWRLMYLYEKWVYKIADNLFLITEEDLLFASQHYGIDRRKMSVVTYGTEVEIAPSIADKKDAQSALRCIHNIQDGTKILLFNGAFNYAPNIQALRLLRDKIVPQLENAEIPFRIIICGKDIPADVLEDAPSSMLFVGFVDDINLYFRGADIFLNPIVDGGGIKTKLVEALSFDRPVVSFRSGAIGIPQSITGRNLSITEDNDINGFVAATIRLLSQELSEFHIPNDFYNYFNWDIIARNAAANIIKSFEV